tara:strand:- start:101 stop:310 length:210 start_codon:yes stop_codon:yes gene_type:complete
MDVKTMKKERDALAEKHDGIEIGLGEIAEAMNTLELYKLVNKDVNLEKPQNKYEEAFVHLWHAYLRLSE